MTKDEVVSIFDQDRARNYDAQATFFAWRPTFDEIAVRILDSLPADARILCVGVGTGLELVPLALKNPGWRFLALDPAEPMLEICRQRTREAGVEERCEFFNGFLEDLPAEPQFDAATCLLVSHFMTEPGARVAFFRQIARRLRPGGVFINGDLAGDQTQPHYAELEDIWCRSMAAGGVSAERLAEMKKAYRSHIDMRPAGEVGRLLEEAGFAVPTLFYQALLLHLWYARRL